MLNLNECIRIGTFQKPYGFYGTLQLFFEPGWESSLEQAEILITGSEGLPVPWFVAKDGIRITSSHSALVDLDWVDNPESAKKLCGWPVYLLKDQAEHGHVPSETPQWEGYQLLNEKDQLIGEVVSMENFSGNMVLVVKTATGEKMVPFHEDLVVRTDASFKKIWMALPEGLLEI